MRAAYRSLLSTMEPDDIQQECNIAVLENPMFPGIACVNRIKSLCRRVYAQKRGICKTWRYGETLPVTISPKGSDESNTVIGTVPVCDKSRPHEDIIDAKLDYEVYLSVCTPSERKAVEAKCHGQSYDRVAYHRGITRIREAFNAG